LSTSDSACAALTLTPVAFAERQDQLRAVVPAKPPPVARSEWMKRQHQPDGRLVVKRRREAPAARGFAVSGSAFASSRVGRS
jgi:hypothetical protein